MIELYRKSWRYFVASLPALLLFAFLLEAALWYFEPKSGTGGTFVALTVIAYYFHRHFLFGEEMAFKTQKPAEGAPPLKFGWFILLSAALVLVPLGISLLLALQLLPRGISSPRLMGAVIILFAPMYLIALSFFGTALPASVARDGTYRLSQGIRSGFQTMWRLLLGPALTGTVLIALTLATDRALEAGRVLPTGVAELGYFTLLRTVGFFTTIVAVAVLCEMYSTTRPIHRAA